MSINLGGQYSLDCGISVHHSTGTDDMYDMSGTMTMRRASSCFVLIPSAVLNLASSFETSGL